MSSLGRFLRWGSANGHFPSAAAGVVVVSPGASFTPPLREVEDFTKEADEASAQKLASQGETLRSRKAEFWWEKNQGVGKLSTSENHKDSGSGNQEIGR